MSASTASEEHGSSRALARSSAVMASGTLVSRVLGLVRMALLAWAIGNLTPAGNIWETANTIPNAIFLLLAAGVLNVLLLPQLTRAMTRGQAGQEYSDRLLTLAVGLLVVGTLVFWLATPLVTKLNAFAWEWGSPELNLAILFAYFCIPQMLFYGLHTVLGQVLAAHHRFAAYMWSPALANVVQITGILLFAWRYPTAQQVPPEGWTFPMIALLGGSATLGIVLQALVLFPAVRATGFRWRPRWGFRGVGLGTAGVMAFWAFAEVGLSQGGMLAVNNLLAWAVLDVPEAAGRNAYFYAFSVFMLPHSLLALSLLTALYPVLSKAAAAGDLRGLAARAETGMRMLLTAMVPIAVGMMLLAPLLVRVIYPFSTDAAHAAIAPIVQAFTIGLIPYGVYLLCSRVFYSFEDARTPFFFQVALTSTLLLATAVALTQPETRAAIFAATGQGVGQILAAGIGLHAVRRRLPDLRLRPAAATLGRALLTSLLALLPAWGLVRVLDRPGLLGAVVALAVSGVVYLAVYGALALVLGVGEVRTVAAPLLRRVPGLTRFAPRATELEVMAAEAAGPVPGDPGTADRTGTGVDPAGPTGTPTDRPTEAPTNRPMNPVAPTPTSAASSSSEGGEGTLGGQDAPDGVSHGGEDSTMDRLEVGAQLGDRYALEELLAEREGGGLQYWSARDITLGRLVAVTALPSSGADAAIAEVVLDGARRVASVDDPRLVRVLDVGDEDGVCWVVEEGLTEAESLASLVAEHPLPAEEVRRLVGEAAAGLESARRRGLHHLYLNPHSVLRTTDGIVKISGVGVASALEGTDDVTADEASLIDTADLISLLYTGLTGRWPGEDLPGVRTARRLADDSLPAPSELVAGIPGDLDALCRMVHGSGADLGSAPHTPGELARQLSPWSSELVRGPRPGELTAPSSPEGRGGDAATDALAGAAGASAAATAAHPTRADDGDSDADAAGDETTVVPQTYYRTSRGTRSDETGEMGDLLGSERAAQGRDERGPGSRAEAVPAGVAAAATSQSGAGGARRPGDGSRGRGPDAGHDDPGGLDEARGTGLQTVAVIGIILAILAGAFLLGWFLLGGLDGEDEVSGGGTTVTAPADGEGGDTDVATATGDTDEQTAPAEAEPPDEEPAAPAAGGPVSILGITSFDPEGDGDERDDLTPLAVDGDPETAWNSHTYLSPGWGSLKSGVGLILDLGEGASVSEVEVDLLHPGVGASLWLSEEPTRDGATELGSGSDLEDTWTVSPDSAATGRYLILWFDTAATTDSGEIVGVREIIVR